MSGTQARDIVFTRDDGFGSQVLVTVWSDGRATLSERPTDGMTWGPPLDPSFDSKDVPEYAADPLVTRLQELVTVLIADLEAERKSHGAG
jgi:hypothetical protein